MSEYKATPIRQLANIPFPSKPFLQPLPSLCLCHLPSTSFLHLLLQSLAEGTAQASTGSSCKVFFCLHQQANADAAPVNDPTCGDYFHC